ncbi:MAG TPA: cyanophycin synthetase, partial [Levilinea sp.]|nr:cyanophycin synthetase [Levilinea sp.]
HLLPYGLGERNGYYATGIAANAVGGLSYTAYYQPTRQSGSALAVVALKVPGEHNVHNSLAALAVAHQLGLPVQKAADALSSFSGTGRRFDLQGEASGITVIDDYAHHPTEIRATLAAARQRYSGRRIWVIWQPHTYTRLQTLLEDFLRAFDQADQVIVTEVYAAREHNPAFSAAQVAAAIDHPSVAFAPTLENAVEQLLAQLQPGDVLLVLSAGDADQISAKVLQNLKQKENDHG